MQASWIAIPVLVMLALGANAADSATAAKKTAPARARGEAMNPEPTAAGSARALAAEIDSLVARALAGANTGARGTEPVGPTTFDGIAWVTGEGMNAGTSRLGTQLDGVIRTSLANHGGATEPTGLTSRGLPGARFLTGGYRVLKGGLELSLVLMDASGLPVSKVSKVLRSTMGVMSGEMNIEDVLPPNSEKLKGLVKLVRQTMVETPADFTLTMSTDRGIQAAYEVGEKLHVLLEADHDCYVRLYHVAYTDKALTLIFPNRADANSRIIAGTVKQVPANGTGVEFEVSEPAGVDALVAIASKEPFEDDAFVAAELANKPSGLSLEQTRGVSSAGPYLMAQDVSDQRVKDILSRGLLVRMPAPTKAPAATPVSATSVPAPTTPGATTPVATPTTPVATTPVATPTTPVASVPAPTTPGATTPVATPTTPVATTPAAPVATSPGKAAITEQPGMSLTAPANGETAPASLATPAKHPPLARALCFFTTLPRPKPAK